MKRTTIATSILSIILLSALLSTAGTSSAQETQFRSAQPVWPSGKETEMNCTAGFRAVFNYDGGSTPVLRIAGSSIYRIYLNGVFVGHGPARGPHGFYRVDEWRLSREAIGERNVLAIEAAGYNVNSYYILDQPSFIQAEVVQNGKVLAYTVGTGGGFEAAVLEHRVRKVQRYSFQRTFIEYYRLADGFDGWKRDPDAEFNGVPCSVVPKKRLIPRRVAYPDFNLRQPVGFVSRGRIERDIPVETVWKHSTINAIGPDYKGYPENELAVLPSTDIQKIRTVDSVELNEPYDPGKPFSMDGNSWRIYDFGTNLTGFIGLNLSCPRPTKIFVVFDELLTDDDVDFKRMNAINIVGYELEPGRYELESIEPYTFRYMKIIVFDDRCDIDACYLREYANSEVDRASFASSDSRLNRLFEAARETFRQNAVDIFMDCPSRERAGWLCDSFFTSRVAWYLTGNTSIEKNFFENYLLPETFNRLPDGMLPMCYPAEHYNGRFIPNWALWFVVELEEYAARSGDRELVDALERKILALFEYFEKFENEDGLLEKLESWVFVEWSAANKFVQDVNYPSNMLYAGALSAAGRLYDTPAFLEKAHAIREAVRVQAFDGSFFTDNALRENGRLKTTVNRTEVCQYYGFYFGCADPSKDADVWDTLVTSFGPDRKADTVFPEIHPANSFIGNYLRIELLSREGLCDRIREELVGYFLYMADRTGTLWENKDTRASCNHGFASHVAYSLYRDILGIHSIDAVRKVVELRFTPLDLDWCEGAIPVWDGKIAVSWRKDSDTLKYKADVPAGYQIRVINQSGMVLERM